MCSAVYFLTAVVVSVGRRTPASLLLPCSLCLQKGTYLPQTYIIHEEMVVTGKVHNMRQLGPFIYRLCNGKDTYRLSRRVTHRRKLGLMGGSAEMMNAAALCVAVEVMAGALLLSVSLPVSLSGINKREAKDCHHIRHFENTFVVETVICDEA